MATITFWNFISRRGGCRFRAARLFSAAAAASVGSQKRKIGQRDTEEGIPQRPKRKMTRLAFYQQQPEIVLKKKKMYVIGLKKKRFTKGIGQERRCWFSSLKSAGLAGDIVFSRPTLGLAGETNKTIPLYRTFSIGRDWSRVMKREKLGETASVRKMQGLTSWKSKVESVERSLDLSQIRRGKSEEGGRLDGL